MKYRAEIDGLRALAVLPVILFHAGFEWFSGGFVGVDVFFVISGYLITTIIISEMAEGKFSIVNFYERRARRILPALFFVMAVCLPFAWLWLTPNELKDFGQSLVAVSTFSSNIFFWSESGYFATTNELKPLLHTWSLAVEEQYYILFPVFLMLTWRFGLRWILVILFVVFIISLGAAQWGSYNSPSFTFYMLPTRGWELLVGVFIAFYLNNKNYLKSKNLNQSLSLIGFCMVTYSIFSFNESTPFPSLYALIPTIGTGLIILCAIPQTIIYKVLSLRLFVGIGLVSYSTYLWHQPLLAFGRHGTLDNLSDFVIISVCIASIFFGWFSWRYVEKPFRQKNVLNRKSIFSFSIIGICLFSAIGLSIISFNGSMSRIPIEKFHSDYIDITGKHLTELQNDQCNISGVKSLPTLCKVGNTDAKPLLALIGDSHAYTLKGALEKLFKLNNSSFMQFTKNGCPPSINIIASEEKNCRKYMDYVLTEIENSNINTVILAARWGFYITDETYDNQIGGLEIAREVKYSTLKVPFDADINIRREAILNSYYKFIEKLHILGKRVIIVGPIPEHGWSVPERIAKRYLLSGEIYMEPISLGFYDERFKEISDLFDKTQLMSVQLIDTRNIFCGNGISCTSFDTVNGALYFDDDHLSKNGARLVVDDISKLLFFK
ncbi:acyltransferase [Gammaproteobacteria bacterium]|nr:acyltransferase [Gammaproteobacteria bacterium]